MEGSLVLFNIPFCQGNNLFISSNNLFIFTLTGNPEQPRLACTQRRINGAGARVSGLRQQVHPLPLPPIPHPKIEEERLVSSSLFRIEMIAKLIPFVHA